MTTAKIAPIKILPVADLIPYERNPKKHPQEQIDALATMFLEFGFDQAIVVDGGMVIIKGHGRRLAAIKAGLTHVPVIVRSDLSAAKVRASRIADNMIARTDWETESLIAELKGVQEDDESLLTKMGLADAEMTAYLLDPEKNVPPAPVKTGTELHSKDFEEFDHTCPKCGFEFDDE